MAKHVWKLDGYGEVDIFAYDSANHNGPECVVCGKSFCHHCHPEYYDEECTGTVNNITSKCEWCNNNSKFGFYITDIDGDFKRDLDGKLKWGKVNYCPNCGRSLT